MKMNSFFKKSFFILLALVSVLVVSCDTDDDEVEIVPRPTVTSVNPTLGEHGASVTITGTNLEDASSVKFGDATAAIGTKSGTSITTTVPQNAAEGSQTITVTTPQGTATISFTVLPQEVIVQAPSISSINPAEGIVGSEVVITGANLDNATVSFGDIEAVITANTATSITTSVPNDSPEGALDIQVTTAAGTVTSSFTVTVEDDGGAQGRFYVHNDGVVLDNGFREHGGNNHLELDRASTEQVFEGESAIKFVSPKSPNAQFGFHLDPHGTLMNTGEYTHLVFSVYGGEGAGDIRVYLREKQENGNDVAQANIVRLPVKPVAGEWTTYEISLKDLGTKVDLGGDEFVPSGLYGPLAWFEMMFESVGSSEGGDPRTFYLDEIYFVQK